MVLNEPCPSHIEWLTRYNIYPNLLKSNSWYTGKQSVYILVAGKSSSGSLLLIIWLWYEYTLFLTIGKIFLLYDHY